jgi:hypothetical protein
MPLKLLRIGKVENQIGVVERKVTLETGRCIGKAWAVHNFFQATF